MLSPLKSLEGLRVTAAIRDISVRKAAEEHLTRTEVKYRGLLDAAPDAMVVVDQGGQIVLLNVQAEKQFGYPRDELIGQQVTTIIPVGFAEQLIADDLRSPEDALGQQIGTGIELSGHRKDGSEFPIEIMLSPLKSLEGLRVTAAIRDISVRKAAEEHLTRSEAKYRGLLETAPDAMVVVDQGGQIVLLNVQAEKQFGYPRDELIGQQVTTIIPVGFAERLIADDLRSPEDALGQQIGTGIELSGHRKDGSEFPIEIMLSPLKSLEGLLVTAAIRDISVRKAAEEHLTRTEVKYRGLLEAAPDAMVVVDQGGQIVLLNVQAEKQFGYPRDELIGQQVTTIIPVGFAERLIADDPRSPEDALGQQIGTGIELSGHRKDGSEFPIEIMLSPRESPEGLRVTAAIRDISERKRAQDLVRARDHAESANRAKSRFLAGMSHELRTPLNGMMGYARLLHMEGGLNAKQSARVDAMLSAGTHLLEMINSVLDLSQIDAGRLELQVVEVDPRVIAAACLDLVRPTAEAKHLALSLATALDVAQHAMVDPTRLRQVLLNLLGNAVKFTCKGSVEMRLRITPDGTRLRFEVADTGPGIAPQYRQKLFKDFERLGVEPTGTVEGAGLGLALSGRLTALMGGRIGQEANPGGGSLFWIELPLMARPAMPVLTTTLTPAAGKTTRESASPQAALSERLLRVLVVDDMAINRDIASAFLRHGGHEVVCAESGVEAVEVAASGDFGIVLMDVRMPGMDGLEATRRIRALAGPRGRVPIVALTAQAFVEQVQECHRAGMDGHLAKPFTLETLLAIVLSVAARGTGIRETSRELAMTALPPATESDPLLRNTVSVAESPIHDHAVFERTVAFLQPEAVVTYLRTLTERSEILLRKLGKVNALDFGSLEVAAAAHVLAGSAAMFGFRRLSDTASCFERAIETGSREVPLITTALITTLEITLQAIRPMTVL